MNRTLSTKELQDLSTATPIPVMSRRDKLLRLAHIVRTGAGDARIYNGLEHMPPSQWALLSIGGTAFAAAAADPILGDAGLKNAASVADVQKFFELTRDDLHAFSCDCGGALTNEEMARRIEHIAHIAG